MVKVTKKGNKAWVTFAFAPREDITSVELMGEWSEWKNEAMKQKKNGEFSITKVLKTGNNYEFGYRVNGIVWNHDPECPSVPSPFGSENSLLEL